MLNKKIKLLIYILYDTFVLYLIFLQKLSSFLKLETCSDLFQLFNNRYNDGV